jgi:prevent-host-death family protein
METISQRMMRNDSGAVLRRVAQGETLVVSNDGEPVAVLSPYTESPTERLRRSGALSTPTRRFTAVPRVAAARSTEEMLAEERRR